MHREPIKDAASFAGRCGEHLELNHLEVHVITVLSALGCGVCQIGAWTAID